MLLPVVNGLFNKAVDIRGEVLREAVWDALFLFPTLVLGPQIPGASSTTVRSEIETRLDLWNKGQLDTLVARAKSAIRPRMAGVKHNGQHAERHICFVILREQRRFRES
jgi:hypothetical protein